MEAKHQSEVDFLLEIISHPIKIQKMEAKHQSEVDFVLEIFSHPIEIQKMEAKHQSEVDIFFRDYWYGIFLAICQIEKGLQHESLILI